MGGVPSVPTDPSRRLRVIGAGYSRTGTVSLSLALENLLDGPVCHGGTQILGREDGEPISVRWQYPFPLERQRGDKNRPSPAFVQDHSNSHAWRRNPTTC